jgi:hypothetical protein
MNSERHMSVRDDTIEDTFVLAAFDSILAISEVRCPAASYRSRCREYDKIRKKAKTRALQQSLQTMKLSIDPPHNQLTRTDIRGADREV